ESGWGRQGSPRGCPGREGPPLSTVGRSRSVRRVPSAEWPEHELRLEPLPVEDARALLRALPGAGWRGRSEAEALIESSERMPGRLVRLARAAAGRQRLLFPPLCEPRATA